MRFDYSLYGNSIQTWLIALGIAVGTCLGLVLLRRVAVGRLGALSARTENQWDDLLVALFRRTSTFLLVMLGLLAGSSVLQLPARLFTGLRTVGVLALLIQGGIWATTAVTLLLAGYQSIQMEKDRGAATMISAVAFLVQLVLWTVVLLLALDNLGVDVTALIAGLGVGGIAVALAAQNILGDLFASLAIVLDKPFVLRDFIIVDSYLGTVDHIGLKTTRLRSLSGEQLIFSNADLLSSRIRNYGRMYERRVVFTIRATYQTSRQQAERIPGIIRQAVEDQRLTRFDRSHFAAYGEYGLEFESVYYVLSPDYNLYMDIQQAINLAIHARFESEGIAFAIREQRVHLERRGAESATARRAAS
jgi:small-conductance mechanosensitive channel